MYSCIYFLLLHNIPSIDNSISKIKNVVNYEADGSKNTIFEQISNLRNIKQITKDSNDFANAIIQLNGTANLTSDNIDRLSTRFQHCDKSVISAAKSLQSGRMNLDNFRDVANSATTATSGFVASLKSIAINMAIFFAISTAVQLVGKAIDALVVTTEELNEKFEDSVEKYNSLKTEISSLNAELKTTKDEIEQLESLPNLTFIEQEELIRLKEASKELEREIELKNALSKSRYSEAGQTARDYFNSVSDYDTGYKIDRDTFSYKAGFVLQDTGSKFGTPIEEANAQLKIYEQLVNDIKVAEERVLEAKKAENYENTTAYKQAVKELDALEKRASDVNQSLNESYTSFSEKKVYLDPIEDSGLLSSIKEFEDELYRVLSIGTSPTDKFNALWDSSEFRKYKLELENLSKTGELDSSVISSNEQYKELLDATGMSASEVASHINSIVTAAENAGRAISASASFEQAFNNLPINKLEEYIAIANSDGFNKNNIEYFAELNAIVKETGVSIDDLNSTITTIAESNGFVSSVSLIQGIQDSYDVLEEVKKSFADTQTIGLESLNKISAKYPELNTAIAQYNQGLISSEELIHLLELAYNDDVDAFRRAMVEKLSSDEGFWDKVMSHYDTYFTDLANAYGVDLRNYKTLAEAKAGIDAELIKKLSIGWSEYYDAIIDPLTGLATGGANFTGDENSDLLNGGHNENLKAVIQAANAYNVSKKRLNDIAEKAEELIALPDFGDMTNDDDTDSKSSGSTSTKQEEIDWIARRKELLEQLHQVQQEIADDETATYAERLSALDSLIEKDRERAQVAQEAASRYEQAWLEASANLTEEDKKYVINGGNDIKKYDAQELADKGIVDSVEAGEKYIENLKKAIEYRDLMTESQREELANRKEMILHEKAKIDLLKIELDLQQDLNGATTDQINSQMELLEAEGKYVNESYYKDLLQQFKESQSIAEDKLDVLYDELDAAKEAGEEYDGILVEIEQCKNEIIQCQVEQAELNDTIKRLPIERLQMFRDLYAQIVEDMDNYMSLQSSMGLNPTKEELQQYIDLYNEQIDSALKQQGMLKDLLDDYGHGSDKFNETAQEIQDLDNEISSLLVNINELNYQMLQIPVTEMAEEVEKLSVLKEVLNNPIAEDNAKGLQTTVEQYRDLHSITLQQLSVLAKQKSALTELLDVYDEESDYYKETVEQINQINGEMSQLVQETYKWSYELLNLPIENLEKVNSNLQLYSSILGDVISEYDSALSGINTLIDREIEGIEKELELLEQVNKARSIELSLEQAKYNLDRAIQQKNILAIKDGEQVWINDIDAERDAKEQVASAEYDKMVYSLEQQQEYLESIREKWQLIKEEIEEAANIQDANDMFGVDSNWQDKVLSGSDDDLRTLFKQLYESASMEKESVDKQVESNERISQMMNEFVTRYQEGSLTYQQALDGINNLLSSMGDGLSAIENLSGMMDLDNIASIGDIVSSTQGSITESAELLKKYMAIVESNKQSVEGFETSWDSMSGAVKETVDSFNAAVDSMDAYLDAFVKNSDAISEHTNSWEEMQSLIADQIEALKKAAEELEKLSKQSSSKQYSYEDDTDDSDYVDEKPIGVHHGEYGRLYNYDYENNTLVHPETGEDLGVSNYIDFMEKYEDDLKKGTYHKGIFKGQIGASSGTKLDDELQKLAHPPISNDERLVVGQVGEYVYQPEQILNTIENAQRMALPPMEELLPHLFVNTNTKGLMNNQTKQLVDLLHKEYTNPSIDPINSSNSQVIDFSIGELHLHEIQDVEQFANKLFANIEPIVTQKIRKIF